MSRQFAPLLALLAFASCGNGLPSRSQAQTLIRPGLHNKPFNETVVLNYKTTDRQGKHWSNGNDESAAAILKVLATHKIVTAPSLAPESPSSNGIYGWISYPKSQWQSALRIDASPYKVDPTYDMVNASATVAAAELIGVTGVTSGSAGGAPNVATAEFTYRWVLNPLGSAIHEAIGDKRGNWQTCGGYVSDCGLPSQEIHTGSATLTLYDNGWRLSDLSLSFP